MINKDKLIIQPHVFSINTQPAGNPVPAFRQFAIQLSIIRLESRYQAPEALGVVHMPSVTQLVNHQVPKQLRFQEKQAQVQADCAPSAAAAPAGALRPDLQLLEWHAGELRQCPEHRFKLFPCDRAQPAPQSVDAEFFVADLACENDLPADRPETHGFRAIPGLVANWYHSPEPPELDRLGQREWFRWML